MALIKCPECGAEISDEAKSCPQCGKPLNHPIYRADIQHKKQQNPISTIMKKRIFIVVCCICVVILSGTIYYQYYKSTDAHYIYQLSSIKSLDDMKKTFGINYDSLDFENQTSYSYDNYTLLGAEGKMEFLFYRKDNSYAGWRFVVSDPSNQVKDTMKNLFKNKTYKSTKLEDFGEDSDSLVWEKYKEHKYDYSLFIGVPSDQSSMSNQSSEILELGYGNLKAREKNQ